MRVRLWSGRESERAAAREAGLDAQPTPLGVDIESIEAELEEVSDALVMSASDDFNALAAYELRRELGRDNVYRLTPRETPPAVEIEAGAPEGRLLFGPRLTYEELTRRLDAGAEIVAVEPGNGAGAGAVPLFLLGREGELRVLAEGEEPPAAADGDRLLCLRG